MATKTTSLTKTYKSKAPTSQKHWMVSDAGTISNMTEQERKEFLDMCRNTRATMFGAIPKWV